MKEKRKINKFTFFIIVISIIVGIEIIIIFSNVFSIKSENGRLKYELYKVTQENSKLIAKNESLEKIIKDFQEPKQLSIEVPDGWRVFRHLSLGFEVAIPKGWSTELGKGAKDEPILRITSQNSSIKLDFKTEDIKEYWNIDNYVNKKYKYGIYVKDSFVSNNQKFDIYKQSGSKLYYVLIKGKNYIFDISSTSEEYLKKIIGTFRFI